MRWVWTAALLAACSAPAPPPAPRASPVPATEPDVRVHLRSFGEWTQLRVEGKGGLTIEAGGRTAQAAATTIVATNGGAMVQGIEGKHARIVLRAGGGIFQLGPKTYAGTLVIDKGTLVNVVPLENYVLGVLRGELRPTKPQ